MHKILKNNVVRKLLALFFILVFALSNTPKKALHNIFANHSDILKFETGKSKILLSKAEFHCNCNNPVVINPFISSENISFPVISVFFKERIIKNCNNLPSYKKIFFELRGPPSIT